MVTNRDIGKGLREISAYLEMEGVGFKPRAYEKAADAVEAMEEPVSKLFAEGGIKRVATVPGVGKSIAEKISEFIETGKVDYLEEMKSRRPVDLMELTAIEGVGPKTVGMLYDALGVRTLDDLERVAREGKVRSLRGFGEKSEQEILRGLAFLRQHRGRFPLGEVLPLAYFIEQCLRELDGVDKVTVAGSVLRRKETVGDVDVLVVSRHADRVMDFFVTMPEVTHVHGKGPTKSSVRLENGLDVDLRVVPAKSFGAALNYFTGSKAHNVHLRRIAQERGLKLNEYGLFKGTKAVAGKTEEDLYRALDLPFIPPELREDRGEIEAAREGRLPKLIGYRDLKGDLQTQTDWTDGKHSIADMAREAQANGLEYIAITDHTISLAMMGMDETKLAKQMEAIEAVDRRSPGIRVLRGAEVNVMPDGSLDIGDSLLSRLDVVGVGVHSHFHQSRSEMTERLCRAMRNPHVDILFHPTGRVVLKRDPYDLDLDEVLRVARETGTVLEIDAIPDRLDLKDEHVRKAIDAGVKLVIDSDAHATAHFGLLHYGVAQARRGWATGKDVLNTLPVERFLASLKDGRKARR
ncbi:MAG: DNA polymerase/3'-5' exonuclease PolX [Vicinamibacteria bacterium]